MTFWAMQYYITEAQSIQTISDIKNHISPLGSYLRILEPDRRTIEKDTGLVFRGLLSIRLLVIS